MGRFVDLASRLPIESCVGDQWGGKRPRTTDIDHTHIHAYIPTYIHAYMQSHTHGRAHRQRENEKDNIQKEKQIEGQGDIPH